MMPHRDDMMVADGIRQEVFCIARVSQTDGQLRAAEVRLGLVADELTLGNEEP